MRRSVDVASSLFATLAEQGRGVQVRGKSKQPKELLELYDMEGCPFCRMVRETLTELDLDVIVYPCPKTGIRYRPLVERLGGKQQFPFLMDPNTDVAMYESADIIDYLYRTYASKPQRKGRLQKLLQTGASASVSMLRIGKGLSARENSPPPLPLELYSFETSPFSRLVRERLTELELPYILRQCGRTQLLDWALPAMRERLSPDYEPSQRNRRFLLEHTGKVAIPYLIDPNTGMEMFESQHILRYLDEAYAA